MTGINILEHVLDPDYWIPVDVGIIHKTEHSMFGKGYGDDSTCETCVHDDYDAHCNLCETKMEHSSIACGLSDDEEYEVLLKCGVDESIAKDMAYNDNYDELKSGYYIIWPSIEDVKNYNKEAYFNILENIMLNEESDDEDDEEDFDEFLDEDDEDDDEEEDDFMLDDIDIEL